MRHNEQSRRPPCATPAAEATRGPAPLAVLVVEDSEADFDLLVMLLTGAGFDVRATRVDTEPDMRAALARGAWDIVISDHSLPRFSADAALATLQSTGVDVPFLIVSGRIGEDAAVDAMLAGADDYVMKSRLARLVPAIERSLRNAEARRRRREVEAQLRESETRLRESHRELRALSAHLERAKEAERSRIAREIHDDIGGTLTGLRADLAWLRRRYEAEGPAMEKLASMSRLLDSAMEASTRIARDLRPPILDFGFLEAVQWQAADFRKRTGVACEVLCEDPEVPLSGARATAVFRIFQELLTNVTKHAQARAVAVRLVAGGGNLLLEVVDDGRGIDPADLAKRGSFGIRGMHERAQELGGELELAPQAPCGTRATLLVPIEEKPA